VGSAAEHWPERYGAVASVYPVGTSRFRSSNQSSTTMSCGGEGASPVGRASLIIRERCRITAEALAQLIDRTIVPELHAAEARLKELDRVPHEHQPLVAGAEEYFRLRDASWRLRVEGLQKAKGLTPGQAGVPASFSRLSTDRIRSSLTPEHSR